MKEGVQNALDVKWVKTCMRAKRVVFEGGTDKDALCRPLSFMLRIEIYPKATSSSENSNVHKDGALHVLAYVDAWLGKYPFGSWLGVSTRTPKLPTVAKH